jgi:hypothetical protein
MKEHFRQELSVQFRVDDSSLEAATFLDLVNQVWPGAYNSSRTEQALARTFNITAWVDGKLVGSVRVLSDGYFFGTIPGLLIDPTYQYKGILNPAHRRYQDDQ